MKSINRFKETKEKLIDAHAVTMVNIMNYVTYSSNILLTFEIYPISKDSYSNK